MTEKLLVREAAILSQEAKTGTYIPVPSSSFGASFSEMFLDRISNIDTFKPLQALESYQNAKSAYSSVYNTLCGETGKDDIKNIEKLIRALHRIQDIETEYIYRLGMQEGLNMRGPDFLISGIK